LSPSEVRVHTPPMLGGAGSRFVAIIDDDRSLQRAVKDLMESAGLAARCYGSAEEFLESDLCDETGCLVLDIVMPGMSGLELQAKLNVLEARIPIIFITARGDAQLKTRAMKAGAVEFLSKPFDDDVLLEMVRAALRGSSPSRE
jgi:FixJ family two-component response regulator